MFILFEPLRLSYPRKNLPRPQLNSLYFHYRFHNDFPTLHYFFGKLGCPDAKNASATTATVNLSQFLPIFPLFRIFCIAMLTRLGEMI